MNIGPVTNRPPEINVTDAVTLAYERVKQMLFKPFDLNKWFVIGFCAWLAALGEAGGAGSGYNGGFNNHGDSNSGQPTEQLRHFYHHAREYVMDNFYWIVPLAVFLVVLGLALWVTLLWLSSRGKFMFLHCVALDKAEVQLPWARYAGVANSLFWFRLVLALVAMILLLPLLLFSAVIILKMVMQGEANVAGILLSAGLVTVLLVLALGFGILAKFMGDFVVPIMYLRGISCVDAWREFIALLKTNAGHFALYLLFQIVLEIALGSMVVFAILLTCCIAGCVMALPYVGTVLLLPVLVFKRSYALYYLSQFGAAYNVFPKSEPPPSATASFPLGG